jgi:AraC family transcriptional regulator, ethanolamine operon transcriptional activator
MSLAVASAGVCRIFKPLELSPPAQKQEGVIKKRLSAPPGRSNIEIPQSARNARPPLTPVGPGSAVTVVEISDPTAVGENITVLRQDSVQLESKPLRARRVIVGLGSSLLVYHSSNLPIRTRTTLQRGLVAYVVFGPRATGTVNGLPVGPGRVLAARSGVEVAFVVGAGYESVSLLVSPDEIRTHLRTRHREDEVCIPRGVELLQACPAAATGLYSWGRRVADTAVKEPGIFDLPETNSVAQVELFEALLATLGSAVDAEFAPHELTRQAHGRIVRRAEDYALTRPAERLYVTNLCAAAAGVSERTLQYAFKEVMGMTPIAYLTRLRLHRVRLALRAARSRSTTVTREALRWGFWHFGDFSRAYKGCFGELPSETLRRKPHAAFRQSGRDVEVR